MAVKPVPQGYHTVTPYLVVGGAARALDFYKKAFGATETMRMAAPGGKIGHAEITVGDSPIMLSDEWPDHGHRGPKTLGGSPVSLMVYLEDVDAAYARAVGAGATPTRPVADQFYGDRSGAVTDPFGHVWHLSTHIEDVPPDEMARRAEEAMKQMGGG